MFRMVTSGNGKRHFFAAGHGTFNPSLTGAVDARNPHFGYAHPDPLP
jgi:hypothetical protein